MKTNTIIFATLVAAFTLGSGCGAEDAAEWRFGENISGLAFEIYDKDEGIHPSQVVLKNPRNPFRNIKVDPEGSFFKETKFQILAGGGNAGAFYAWATALAQFPFGEHQYYTAVKLGDIADAENGPLKPVINTMAIRAFQAMLDYFPNAETFDATGTTSFRLATAAYLEIVARGGKVEGDWVLIEDTNGNPQAVQRGTDTRPSVPTDGEENGQ